VLIVLSGLPGTGKSAIARGIAVARGLPVLSVDPIESAIVKSGIPRSFETGLAAYVAAETVADGLIGVGLSPVIDAVNSVAAARDMWRRLASAHGTELRVIECVLGDEREQRARLAARERNLAIPEPAWADVLRRREEWTPWPEPHLTIDALVDLDENVAAALAWLG
jgi:predicted kinase